MDLKVLFVTAELAPYSTVGGLSQVSSYLPKALKKLGVDIRLLTPKYGTIDQSKYPLKMLREGLQVPTGEPDKHLICNIKTLSSTPKTAPPIYFLENMEYYELRANVYNYSDDHIRFGLLSRAALEIISQAIFVPDIIHINDWHTGYVANFLKYDYPQLGHISTFLSLHNLYQGSFFDFDHATEMDYDDGHGPLSPFFSDRFIKQNPLRRGLINSDLICTVSPTYAQEILTAEFAPKLHPLFKELRGKLHGILNGLNYTEFSPPYSVRSLSHRADFKADLQKEFNLHPSPSTPILAIVGRLDGQKGLDLVEATIEFVLSEFDVQLVILGTGDDHFRDFFSALEAKFPARVGTHLFFDAALPKKIFSGADVALLPSRYEPGGIVAVEAMRYGCVPLVRATGGLADSVANFDPETNKGTGFSFKSYSPESFLVALTRCLETYRRPGIWKKIVAQAMTQNFSWSKAAKKYLALYHSLLKTDH